jgi:hypothetical protein
MKKYIYHLIILGSVIAASSCSKSKLEPVSTTQLPDVQAFATADRISNQVNAFYGALKASNFYGERYLIYNDIRGGNFLNQTNNGVTGANIWGFSVKDDDQYVNNTWNAAYACINQTNLFLDGMEELGGDKTVGDDLAKQYKAEAKFVRALAYYSLLQLYAQPYTKDNGASPGLPLRLKGIKSSGFSDLARSSVADVYKQVLSDLNDAQAGVPDDYGAADLNTTRAHVNTVIALKVSVYLSMADYDNVITEANKIVSGTAPFSAPSGVKFELQPDIHTVFTNYTTTESIFSMPFTGANEAPGGQSQLGSYYLPPKGFSSAGSGEYSLRTNAIVADAAWKSTDARRDFLFTDGTGKVWLTKFSSPTPYLDWAPVIRYSEVLLSLAEAITRKGNTVDNKAVALLSAVRNRSDAATSYTTVDFANAGALADSILQERNIEFLGEGKRSPDIMRLKMSFPGITSPIGPNDAGYIFPAPSGETQYNKLW